MAFHLLFEYCKEVQELKQFLRPLIAKIGPQTSPQRISRCLIDVSYTGDTELIPILLKKLSPNSEDGLFGLKVALSSSIQDGAEKMVKCLIKFLEKVVPDYNSPVNLYTVVELEKLSIVKYLAQHHHNSYTLEEYGTNHARMLESFLKRTNAQEMYDKIIAPDQCA